MRSPRARLVSALLLLTAATARADAPATQPATAPSSSPTSAPAESAAAGERRAKFLIDQRAALVEQLDKHEKIAARRADQVLTLGIVDGHLSIALAADLSDEASVPLAEGRGAIAFHVLRAGPPGAEPVTFIEAQYLRLHGDDATAPAATFIQLMTSPLNAQITLAEQTPEASTDAQLIDTPRDASDEGGDPPMSKLIFTRTTELDENEPGANQEREGRVQHVAPTFAALIETRHDDVVSAMFEAFTSFRAMHVLSGLSETQLRQVLATDAPADARNGDAVKAMLATLDADDESASATASKRLAGPDGMAIAIALAAADRHGWSPDRAMKVDALLADVLPLSQKQARRVLATPTRLVDALYWPDAAVRKSIQKRLASVAPRVSDIDPDADPYAQAGKIEAIRATLLRPAP